MTVEQLAQLAHRAANEAENHTGIKAFNALMKAIYALDLPLRASTDDEGVEK